MRSFLGSVMVLVSPALIVSHDDEITQVVNHVITVHK